MSYIVIKQIIVFTSGIFKGQKTERIIRVYKKQKPVPVVGSPYRIITEERIK